MIVSQRSSLDHPDIFSRHLQGPSTVICCRCICPSAWYPSCLGSLTIIKQKQKMFRKSGSKTVSRQRPLFDVEHLRNNTR